MPFTQISARRMALLPRAVSLPNNVLLGAACFSLAFWLYYAFLLEVAGPLNADEIYFSHTLWLLNEGKQQYIDFASIHLPAYFQLLRPLVSSLSSSPVDLSFIWGVRSLSGVIIGLYVVLAWFVQRSIVPEYGRIGFMGLATQLLVFVVLAHMVEIRTDTFGLLLVNAAWAIVLCGRTVGRMAAASVLGGFAILFSARAGGMVGVLGILLLYLSARSHDRTGVRVLLYVAGSFVGAGLLLYALAPEWVETVIRSCYLEPARLLGGELSLRVRFLAPDRMPLGFLICVGLLGGVRLMTRSDERERGLMIATACSSQLAMVLLDPAPFQYVYGWAAVPAALGFIYISRALPVYFAALIAASLVGLAIGYQVINGQPPPTLAHFRLTFDRTLSKAEIASFTTPDLIDLLISDKQQKNLTNQLRVRSELCGRLQGTVLASFDTNPVCLNDAMFYWNGMKWPALFEGDGQPKEAMSQETFSQNLMAAKPTIFIWAHRWGGRRALLPTTRRMLDCCYDIHDGFAIYRAH